MNEQTSEKLIEAIQALTEAVRESGEKNAVALGRVEEQLDLRAAAEVLGTSVDAVRKRIARGTLESEKADGEVYVWLDDGAPQSDTEALTSAKDETIVVLREQLEAERDHLRAEREAHAEARRLLAAALERIPPQLEPPTAPSEPRESPESVSEPPPSTGPPEAQEPAETLPWWRRVFGG